MDAFHRLEHKLVLYASRHPGCRSLSVGKGVTKPGVGRFVNIWCPLGLDLIVFLRFRGIILPALRGHSVRALAEGRTPTSWRDTLVVENGNSRMLHLRIHVVYGLGGRRAGVDRRRPIRLWTKYLCRIWI